MRPQTSSLYSLVAACLLAGCGPARSYELAPVSGRVTLAGAPLAGGVVVFQPSGGGEKGPGPGSTGKCELDGRFTLATIEGDAGAVVGSHQVRIYSRSSDQPASEDQDVEPQAERVPARYNYETVLACDVPAAGTDAADFELKSAN